MPKKNKTKTKKKIPAKIVIPPTLKFIAITMSLTVFVLLPIQVFAIFYSTPSTINSISLKPIEIPVLGIADYPLSDGTPAPSHSAKAVIMQDLDSKVVIYEKSPDESMLPASTTKIMTAIIALENYKNLDQSLLVRNEHLSVGHTMGLLQNEVISVNNLIHGLLVESGNDAAFVLANNFPGGYDAFIQAMNQKAQDLNMADTQFLNPSGVEQVGHHTTVRDLATLTSYAYENPIFSKIVSIKKITVSDTTGTINHLLNNTNELLGVLDGVIGVKTGWTENAGECLVTLTERNGRKIISIVLGSNNRFADSENLINWAFDHHNWLKPEI